MTLGVPAVVVAGADDLVEVERLLEDAGLTREGVAACAAGGNLLVARVNDGQLAGCVALEPFGGAVLLRSLAVAANERGRGLGTALVAEALQRARAAGARDASLLTETAGPFFAARGWTAVDRAAAPAGIAGSVEFTSACPATVPALRRAL
jgi:N-acetylglutamate synthase-like GNAT family acetyltransferase